MKVKVDFFSVVCLFFFVIVVNGLDGGGVGENDDELVFVFLFVVFSFQSEVVVNELQEFFLQFELMLGFYFGRNFNLFLFSEWKNVLQLKFQQCWIWEELVS